jgi:hypothetical protein
MIGRGPGAAYAACCSVAFRKLASELFFERAFYRGPVNFPLVNYLLVVPRNCSLPSGSLWGQFTLGLIFSIYR